MSNLYHGSRKKLEVGDYLKLTYSSSGVTGKAKDPITEEYKPAIFATPNYKYALHYVLDNSSENGFLLEPYKKPILCIMNSVDAIYGYVYELDSSNFFQGNLPTVERASFSDEKILGRHEIGIKQLLDMGYDVRIKKANFEKGVAKIRKACLAQEQLKNPEQLTKLLDEYTFSAKGMI